MARARTHLFVAGAIGVLLLAAATAQATHIDRGILFLPGETLITDLSPAGDTDTYVFYGVEGAAFSFTLTTVGGGALPTIDFLDTDKNLLDDSANRKRKSGKLKMKKFVLPATGPFFLRVTGTPVRYQMATKGKMGKVPSYPAALLGAGDTQDFRFGAGIGVDVIFKFKAKNKKKRFSVLSVFDPDGEEIPHGIGAFIKTIKDRRATIRMRSNARSGWREGSDPRRLGDYGVRLGGADPDTVIKVKIKVKHAVGSGTRVIATDLPVVTSLDPGFGRTGTEVRVYGEDFLPGQVEVLFGDTYAKSATSTLR